MYSCEASHLEGLFGASGCSDGGTERRSVNLLVGAEVEVLVSIASAEVTSGNDVGMVEAVVELLNGLGNLRR